MWIRQASLSIVIASLLGCSPKVKRQPLAIGIDNTRLQHAASARLLCVDSRTIPDTWYANSSTYQVFLRSFQDSDGDGVGDLQGLISRLDYLNDGDPETRTDLGVSAIWLMPVHPSPSYHGYDVTDYRSIAKEYGDLKDLDQLLHAAHQRGLRVLLDLVLNHTSVQHPWFVRGKRGPPYEEAGFYLFRETPLSWGQPWNKTAATWHRIGSRFYYGLFWEGMPDLNYRNPQVQQRMLDTARWWLQRGVDGFRLDAVRYLVENGAGQQADQPETHAFWRKLRAVTSHVSPESVLVGEAWTSNHRAMEYFGEGDSLQMLFGFSRASALRSSLKTGAGRRLAEAVCEELKARPDFGVLASFLENHDMDRVASLLGKNGGRQKLALAARLLFALPGSPFIYYGQELGMKNGSGRGDPAKRTPMHWTSSHLRGFTTAQTAWSADNHSQSLGAVAEQRDDPGSLLSIYREMSHLRNDSVSLRVGSTVVFDTGADSSVVLFARAASHELIIVAANLAEEPATVVVPVQEMGWSGYQFQPLWGTDRALEERMELPPLSTRSWRAMW